VIEAWTDSEGDRVVDEQVAYMTTSILADPASRRFTFGSLATYPGFYSNKVWFASKTGTTENGAGSAKDSWIVTYSPVLATVIWNGNHDGHPLTSDSHNVCFKINALFQDRVHQEIYEPAGRWTPGQSWERPSGIQTLTVSGKTDIWPSWYNSSKSGIKKETMTFDSVSKKKATDCTPDETRVDVEVTKTHDPMTKEDVAEAEGYDTENDDDIHQCSDIRPSVGEITFSGGAIHSSVSSGTHPIAAYTMEVEGQVVKQGSSSGSIEYNVGSKLSGTVDVKVTARDSAGYTTTVTKTLTISNH
jgi:penicillin-binding protein 1A